MSRRKLITVVAIAFTALVAAAVTITTLVVGSSGPTARTAVTDAGNQSGASTVTCTWAPYALPTKNVALPPTKAPAVGTAVVHITTNQGPIAFTLDRAAAPCTVASFVSLAKQGYFNDSPCHRVTTSGIWVVQCGDPSGSGSGNPGYFVPDEAKGDETYPAGTLAMARTADPDSGGSQFFVVYRDSPSLMRHLGSLQYTVFGTVTEGLDVFKKVGAAGAQSGQDGRPKLPLQLLLAAPA